MSLTILEQGHLFLETEVKNSLTKQIHYIVKTTPFTIRFGLVDKTTLNFKSCALTCKLLYDLPTRKEVEAPGGGHPLDYVCHPSDDGKTCKVDFRIKVLTTQHQNNYFIIRVALEGNGRRLEADSDPIKSVSKPEQIRRRQTLQEEATEKPSASKKRARGEELLATLDEMKAMQLRQSELLTMLLHNQLAAPVPTCIVGATPSLEEALTLLVRAYEAETVTDRPLKLRKVGSSFPVKDQLILAEISKNLSSLRSSPPATRTAPPPTTSPSPQISTVASDTPAPDSYYSVMQPNAIFDFASSSFGLDSSSLTGDDVLLLGDQLSGWLNEPLGH